MAHRMPLAGLDLPKLRDVLDRFLKVAERWHRDLGLPAVASDAPNALETATSEYLRA